MSLPPQYDDYGRHGQQEPEQPGPAQGHPLATVSLILGILSLPVQLLGPVAWVLGRRAVAEIDAQPERWEGRRSARVGTVLGMVTTAVLLLGLVGAVAYVVLS